MLNDLFSWTVVCLGMFLIAFLWLSYLIRIVLNDEVVQERRRRRMRIRELERRKIEDRANKKAKKK